jgi:hypothetical protein
MQEEFGRQMFSGYNSERANQSAALNTRAPLPEIPKALPSEPARRRLRSPERPERSWRRSASGVKAACRGAGPPTIPLRARSGAAVEAAA